MSYASAPSTSAIEPRHEIGLVLYPGLTQLDLTGPFEVFARVPGARVHLAAETLEPVQADTGFVLQPTVTFAECPRLAVLCVPGGPGQVQMMNRVELLSFLARAGAQAQFVTAVCTGSLLLASAGLLAGYRANTHWMSREFLERLGVEVSPARVVVDRNRITGGGVTAGIDIALTVVAELEGRGTAEAIQLALEYAPAPPLSCGTPESAGAMRVESARLRSAPLLEQRRATTEEARQRLKAAGLLK